MWRGLSVVIAVMVGVIVSASPSPREKARSESWSRTWAQIPRDDMPMLFEKLSPTLSMSCPALLMRNTTDDPEWRAWIYHDHASWFAGGGYLAEKLFREHYAPVRYAFTSGTFSPSLIYPAGGLLPSDVVLRVGLLVFAHRLQAHAEVIEADGQVRVVSEESGAERQAGPGVLQGISEPSLAVGVLVLSVQAAAVIQLPPLLGGQTGRRGEQSRG